VADVGPGPDELIRKRITTEIRRLEFQIESQELEILESVEKHRRLQENIEASRAEIVKQQANLAALESKPKTEKESGGDG